MCREELKMKVSDVPDVELQGAWNALDDDDSGFITAGEFGPFMKRGAPPKGPGWKEKRQKEKDKQREALKAEKEGYDGREVYADVEPASDEALLELSKKFNARLQDPKLFPNENTRDWCVHAPAALARSHQASAHATLDASPLLPLLQVQALHARGRRWQRQDHVQGVLGHVPRGAEDEGL